jgi:hypothetical protein
MILMHSLKFKIVTHEMINGIEIDEWIDDLIDKCRHTHTYKK